MERLLLLSCFAGAPGHTPSCLGNALLCSHIDDLLARFATTPNDPRLRGGPPASSWLRKQTTIGTRRSRIL
jgi:hypothetical protein